MTELPLEILRLISQNLDEFQLLQFQLVNKRWREASSESLYSEVTLPNERAAVAYIRTISSSQKFGFYLKTIYVSDLFDKPKNATIWDKYKLLDTLTKYCFNLRNIKVYSPHHIFWTRLIHAANKGQLPNLQTLPDCDDDESLDLYVCTALAFRKSLTKLDLVDSVEDIRHSLNTWAFQELQGHIKEFINLKTLLIKHCNKQPFSYIVDPLIDSCPHLIALYVALIPEDLQVLTRQDASVIPKPNIRKLACDWATVYKDDQLKYVMRKFPNLQFLRIDFDDEIDSNDWKLKPNDTSYDVMMEFMKYVLNIKEIDMSLGCKRKDIVNYWSELRKSRKSEMLSINYQVYEDSSIATMSYDNEEQLILTYNINSDDDDIPHEEFLSEYGDGIKQLGINYTSSANNELEKTSYLWYTFNTENWIYRVLQLCPSLQELKLIELVELKLPGNSTYQHKELKKLVVRDHEEVTYLGFLRNLSFHVPNLKELEICNSNLQIDDKNGYCVKIKMPYSMLDLITIGFKQRMENIEDYFIKLNTIAEEKYYYITSTGKRSINYESYKRSKKRCLFEITCHSLKKFELKRYNNSFVEYRSTQNF